MPGTLPPDEPIEEPSPSSRGAAPTMPVVELSSSALVEDASIVATTSASDGATEHAPRSLVGSMISDRYRVEELVGQGGMGAVYRGEQVHLRKRVAIKVLRQSIEGMPELAARFEREAIAGAHVQHPNVAAAIDFGKPDATAFFLVAEYAA